jgi:hypothetical protein
MFQRDQNRHTGAWGPVRPVNTFFGFGDFVYLYRPPAAVGFWAQGPVARGREIGFPALVPVANLIPYLWNGQPPAVQLTWGGVPRVPPLVV